MDKNIYVLVGNIGSGKSTWTRNQKQIWKECGETYAIVSRDNIRYAFGDGDYLFDRNLESLVSITCTDYFESCILLGIDNIVIDETNMSASRREDLFEVYDCLPKTDVYSFIAVVFEDYGVDEHVRRRLSSNHGNTTKEKWIEVYNGLKNSYDPPTKKEGFDRIVYI